MFLFWLGQEAEGVRKITDKLHLDDAESDDFRALTNQTSQQTPLSVFQSIYAVLQDDHTGLFPLALALLRAKLTKTEQQKLQQDLVLPAVEGMEINAVQVALIELWLWQAVRRHAIKLHHTPDNIVGARGSSGIREWNGRFSQVVSKLLEARGLKAWLKGDYVTRCEPALRAVFSPGATGSFFVQASKVSLDFARCRRQGRLDSLRTMHECLGTQPAHR
jgi:hypothetical protein